MKGATKISRRQTEPPLTPPVAARATQPHTARSTRPPSVGTTHAARPGRCSVTWHKEEVGHVTGGWEDAEGGGRGGAAVGRQEFSGRLPGADFVVFMPPPLYRTIHGAWPAGNRQRMTSSRWQEASRGSAASEPPKHGIQSTDGMAHAILSACSARFDGSGADSMPDVCTCR